jgi:hypothetical protein
MTAALSQGGIAVQIEKVAAWILGHRDYQRVSSSSENGQGAD